MSGKLKEICNNPQIVNILLKSTYQHSRYAPIIQLQKTSPDSTKLTKRKYTRDPKEMSLSTLVEDARSQNIKIKAPFANGDLPALDIHVIKQLAKSKTYMDRSIRYRLEE